MATDLHPMKHCECGRGGFIPPDAQRSVFPPLTTHPRVFFFFFFLRVRRALRATFSLGPQDPAARHPPGVLCAIFSRRCVKGFAKRTTRLTHKIATPRKFPEAILRVKLVHHSEGSASLNFFEREDVLKLPELPHVFRRGQRQAALGAGRPAPVRRFPTNIPQVIPSSSNTTSRKSNQSALFSDICLAAARFLCVSFLRAHRVS
jgi:hypothetical protein